MKVPVAANCWPVPSGTAALIGVIDRPTNAAGETLNIVCPETVPTDAVIVALPTPAELASPAEDTFAIPGADEDQTAVELKFCVPPSEYVPVAVNCTVCPSGTDGLAGVITMLRRTGTLTDNVAVPLIEPETAVTVVLPAATPNASPVMLTVATVGEDDVHVTEFVIFAVLPSEKVPLAANC